MKNLEINFKIQGRHTSHTGTAIIVDNYSEGLKLANDFFSEMEFDESMKTNKIGGQDGYAIYENYKDSGSVDYFYFAIKA